MPGCLLSFLPKPFFIWVITKSWTTVQLALCNHTESNFDTPYQPLQLEEFKRQTTLFIICHTWPIRNISSCCKSKIFMVCANVLCKIWPAGVSNGRFYSKLRTTKSTPANKSCRGVEIIPYIFCLLCHCVESIHLAFSASICCCSFADMASARGQCGWDNSLGPRLN